MMNTGGVSKLFEKAAARGKTNGLMCKLTDREID